MRRFLALLCVFGAMSIASLAHAERRIALVIGNSVYQNTAELKNPKNDAADMAASLRRLGFEVFEGHDLDKRSMERMIRQFGVKLSGADLALFFYAGHGVAIGGQNYLVPTDARLASEGDADFEGLPLTLVLKQMEREAKTSIVLLDACRDNPLARNLARTMGTRSSQVSQGLAEVRTGVGTLIGFSTQPGNVATDGTGRNSPYAEALLRHIEVSGTDVSGVLIAVRNDVLKATDGRQVPWEHTSLTGQVYLKIAPPSTPRRGAATCHQSRHFRQGYGDFLLEQRQGQQIAGAPAELSRPVSQRKLREPGPRHAQGAESRRRASAPQQRVRRLSPATKSNWCVRCRPSCSAWAAIRAPSTANGRARRRGALTQFARQAKLDLYTEKPSPAALDAVRGAQEPRLPARLRCGQGREDGNCVATTAPTPPAREPRNEKYDATDTGFGEYGARNRQGKGRRRHVLGGGRRSRFRVRAVQRPASAPKSVLSRRSCPT